MPEFKTPDIRNVISCVFQHFSSFSGLDTETHANQMTRPTIKRPVQRKTERVPDKYVSSASFIPHTRAVKRLQQLQEVDKRSSSLSKVDTEKRPKVIKETLESCQAAVNTSQLVFVAQRSAFSKITSSYVLSSTLSKHH